MVAAPAQSPGARIDVGSRNVNGARLARAATHLPRRVGVVCLQEVAMLGENDFVGSSGYGEGRGKYPVRGVGVRKEYDNKFWFELETVEQHYAKGRPTRLVGSFYILDFYLPPAGGKCDSMTEIERRSGRDEHRDRQLGGHGGDAEVVAGRPGGGAHQQRREKFLNRCDEEIWENWPKASRAAVPRSDAEWTTITCCRTGTRR